MSSLDSLKLVLTVGVIGLLIINSMADPHNTMNRIKKDSLCKAGSKASSGRRDHHATTGLRPRMLQSVRPSMTRTHPLYRSPSYFQSRDYAVLGLSEVQE